MSFDLPSFCTARWAALILALSSHGAIFTAGFAYGSPNHEAKNPTSKTGIACGTLACDEIMSALLDDGMPKEKVWAFSTLADEARYSNVNFQWRNVIQNRFGEQIEGILKSRPALVVLSSYSRSDYRAALLRAGIAIMDLPAAQSLADIAKNIQSLAQAAGYSAGGMRLSKKFKERIAQYSAYCKKPTTSAPGQAMAQQSQVPKKLLQFYPENGTITGADSTFTELASLACALNATEPMGLSGWPKLGLEKLLLLDHDAVVIATANESEQPRSLLQGHLQWRKLRSVAAGQVIAVPDRYLSSQSHHILESVERIKQQLGQNPL